MIDRQELGRRGEDLAAEFLVRKGMLLLGRNVHLNGGEIDLLLEDGDTVVVAEVKTQLTAEAVHPVYKINPVKQQKLWRLATIISSRYPDKNVRIDAVVVYWNHLSEGPVINHLENILS